MTWSVCMKSFITKDKSTLNINLISWESLFEQETYLLLWMYVRVPFSLISFIKINLSSGSPLLPRNLYYYCSIYYFNSKLRLEKHKKKEEINIVKMTPLPHPQRFRSAWYTKLPRPVNIKALLPCVVTLTGWLWRPSPCTLKAKTIRMYCVLGLRSLIKTLATAPYVTNAL